MKMKIWLDKDGQNVIESNISFPALEERSRKKADTAKNIEKVGAVLRKIFSKAMVPISNKKFGPGDYIYSPDQIQTLLNLLANSIQATPKGGEISLNIRCRAKTCRISVSDTGTGMSEETKSKMFDPFYTTKKSGNGLGLAICHRIVERHNGYFDVIEIS